MESAQSFGKLVLLAAAAMAFDAASGSARDIFVDPATGRDWFRGTTSQSLPGEDGPVRTLGRAVRLATYGDRIVVVPGAGVFTGDAVLHGQQNPGGFDDAPIIVEGNGAVFDGASPINNADALGFNDGTYRLITNSGPTHTTDFLYVDGRIGARAAGFPQPGEYTTRDGWFVYRTPVRTMIADVPLAESRRNVGVTIIRSNNWTIRNFTFRNFRLDGVRIHGPAKGIEFRNCSFLNNGRAGFANYTNTKISLVDGRIEGNGVAGIVGKNLSSTLLQRVALKGNPKDLDADDSSRTEQRNDPAGKGEK